MISPSNLGQLWKSFSNKLLLQIVYFVYCITVSTLLLSVFDVRSTIGEIVGWSVLSGEVSWSNWPNGCIGQFGTFSVLVSSGFKSEFLFELDNRRLKCFFKFIFFFWKSEKIPEKISLSNLNPIIEEQIIEVIIGYHHLDENRRNPKKVELKKSKIDFQGRMIINYLCLAVSPIRTFIIFFFHIFFYFLKRFWG